MDKQTLSNYGWVVITVLVLAVMLALATPFGEFIRDGFKATYEGFGNVTDKAFAVVGLGGNGGSDEGEQGGTIDPADCDHSAGNYSYEYVPNMDDGTHNTTCLDCGTQIETNATHILSYVDDGDGSFHTVKCLCKEQIMVESHTDDNSDYVCDNCNGAIFHCDHNGSFSYSLNGDGDGSTHIKICNDCFNIVAGSEEAHIDSDNNNECDYCYAETYALFIYNVGNTLYFNEIDGATRYEIYSSSNIGTPIDYFSSCGLGDYTSMNAFDLLNTSSAGTYEFIVMAVDTTNGRNILATSNRLVITLVE